MDFIKKILNLSEVFRVLNRSFLGFRRKLALLAFLGFLGGLLDGIGINVLIPVFSFFTKSSMTGDDFVSRMLTRVLDVLPFQHNLIFLLGLAITLFLFRALILVIFSYISYSTLIDYKNRSVKELLRLTFDAEWPFLFKQKLGYIQATIFRDVQTTSDTMVYLSRLIISVTGLIIYLIFALSLSPAMTLVTLAVGGMAVLAVFPFMKRNRAIFEKMIAVEKLVSSYLIENISGVKYVKSLIVDREVIKRGEDYYGQMKGYHMQIVVFRSFLANFMQPLAMVFISGLFYFYVKQPDFNLPAFLVTVYFIQKIFNYLEGTQSAFHSVNEQIPFMKNILTFKRELERNYEDHGGQKSFKFNRELELKNVDFAYGDNEHRILSGLNIRAKKGEVIGLIGPSGAGKTSVADILLRFLRPNNGEVLLDGVGAGEIDIREWRRNIGYVSQDIFLTNDTIEDNIRFYDEDITNKDIAEAAAVANVDEFISQQKDGMKTVVGDRGVMLSGGQRQRIVLARVLARKPSVLILDEATSALDNESEQSIHKAISGLRGRMTIIIIAHRLSTVIDADRLFVLDNGRIIEEGSPRELMQNEDSYFHKTYNLKQSAI